MERSNGTNNKSGSGIGKTIAMIVAFAVSAVFSYNLHLGRYLLGLLLGH